VLQTLKAFRANQGLLLAGAVAYYALLSIVPMMILAVIALSHTIDAAELLATLGRYLEWLVPGQSKAVVAELANFMAHRDVIGWVLLVTMLFFSSLAFTVLENAMSVIFHHRVAIRRRHFLVSALIPYGYILCLGLGLLLVTLVAGSLQAMGEEHVQFLGRQWSMGGVSGLLLYLIGFAGEVFVVASIYLVMPVGRPRCTTRCSARWSRRAVELSRRLLVWYFATLSQISAVTAVDDGHRRAAEPGDRRHAAAAGCAGDCRIRAAGQRAAGWAPASLHHPPGPVASRHDHTRFRARFRRHRASRSDSRAAPVARQRLDGPGSQERG
jgi:uncharacterized BrkB/YihY/UPF0761 family membrane protein